jgi:hypothetical protein
MREGRGRTKLQSNDLHKEHDDLFPEVLLRRTYVPIKESNKDESLSTLYLSQAVIETG